MTHPQTAHMVVLMLENRSYDHVLYFSEPGHSTAQGAPSSKTSSGDVVSISAGHPYITAVDPGHEVDDVHHQLYGGAPHPYSDTPDNSGFITSYEQVLSKNGIAPAGARSIMDCFGADALPVTSALSREFGVCEKWFSSVPGPTFSNRLFAHAGTCAGYAKSLFDPGDRGMASLLTPLLSSPILTGLLTDPGQVLKRLEDDPRGFVDSAMETLLGSTPESAYVTSSIQNSVYEHLHRMGSAGTMLIPNRGRFWRFYLNDFTLALVIPYLRQVFAREAIVPLDSEGIPTALSDFLAGTGSFRTFAQFKRDVAAGNLPPYSFLEPRYAPGPNLDQLRGVLADAVRAFVDEERTEKFDWPWEAEGPAWGVLLDRLIPRLASLRVEPPTDNHPPHDAHDGERLIAEVYDALRASPLWEKTVLIVLYDEHGGFYDHVPPPTTTAPDARLYDSSIPGKRPEDPDLDFKRLGVRVPALIVSPFVPRGARCSDVFDHTSLLASAREQFGFSGDLGARENAARRIWSVLSEPQPRQDAPASMAQVLRDAGWGGAVPGPTSEIWRGRWNPGWSSLMAFDLIEFWPLKVVPHLLLYNEGTGEVEIQRLRGGGQAPTPVWSDRWSTGWTSFVPLDQGLPSFLSYKRASGDVAIDRVKLGAQGTTTIWRDTWSDGWTSFMPFPHGGELHYLAYKVATGDVALDTVRSDRQGVVTKWRGTWTTGWTTFMPFDLFFSTHYLAYKHDTGDVAVDRIDAVDREPNSVWRDTWTKDWSSFVPLGGMLPDYLAYKASSGRVAVDRFRPDTRVSNLWEGNWSKSWTHFVPFQVNGDPHYLAYKAGSGVVAIDRYDRPA
jgi:hypothetical protein